METALYFHTLINFLIIYYFSTLTQYIVLELSMGM